MFFKAIVWIISIIVGLFSALILLGKMAARQNPVPVLHGPAKWDLEDTVPAGPSFEIPSFNQFLKAAMSGNMPGGNKTSLPLFPASDFLYFSKPYAEWAPEPFSKLPAPSMGFLGTVPGPSPAPIIRIMHILSGIGDLLDIALQGGSFTRDSERSQKAMKSRIWFGLAPMSEARWKSKALDKEENIEEALSVIQLVIDVFKFLASPSVQGDLRDINNRLWAEIDVFQDGCNAVRTSNGEPAPAHNLSKLWLEYMKSHFEYIEHQNRAWVFTHLKTLHTIWKARFLKTFQSGRQINSHQATIRIDHYDMMILNKIQDIYIDADIYVRQRMDGFITENRQIHPLLADIKMPKLEANKIYAEIERDRVYRVKQGLNAIIDERTRIRAAGEPAAMSADFMAAPSKLIDREFGHKEITPEIEKPRVRKEEPWLAELRATEKYGFVIYRLSYNETEEEWKKFLGRLREELGSGWDSVIGAESVRMKARLHWVDGRDHDIPEGDLKAARKHFKTTVDAPSFPTGLTKNICLAVTIDSVTSFAAPPTANDDSAQDMALGSGDFASYLNVLDASYDPNPSTSSNTNTNNNLTAPSTSNNSTIPDPPLPDLFADLPMPAQPSSSRRQPKPPQQKYPKGYLGYFKISTLLLWTDLYALHIVNTASAQTMVEYWALAAQHPWGVYVGPTTGVMRREWRYLLGGAGIWEIIRAAFTEN